MELVNLREVLFRCKEKDTNEWICGYIRSPLLKEETRGQFTGLYDKNNEKIFEGDIVKGYLVRSGGRWAPFIGVVEFHNGAFCVKWQDKIYGRSFVGDFNDLEVIGNIHDNPELLNKGKEQGDIKSTSNPDYVQVVRCKDCNHLKPVDGAPFYYCGLETGIGTPFLKGDEFCSFGAKKEG